MAGTKYLGGNDDNKKINPVKEGERLYSKEDAVGFAEWMDSNAERLSKNTWRVWDEKVLFNPSTKKWVTKTTEELFNLYTQSPEFKNNQK